MQLLVLFVYLLPWIASSFANVEKTIFLAPEAIKISQHPPNLETLHLEALTPFNHTLHTQVPASFPNPDSRGTVSWFLLDKLQQEQRHEVRICWTATQPTDFTLDTFTLSEVFGTHELISSLASYSETRLNPSIRPSSKRAERSASVLFLRVVATADYYTTNKTLMHNVPLVDADIILDPFILNILPQSLLPTGLYLTIIAVIAWYLSGYIWHIFSEIASPDHDKKRR